MIAVYDLSLAPPTYDFTGFLVTAERARIDTGESGLTIAIVPGPNHGFRQDNLPPFDPKSRRRMLDNIVKPMCKLLPSCEKVIEIDRGKINRYLGGAVFPPDYYPDIPTTHYGTFALVDAVRAGIMPLMVEKAKPKPGLVTITLRQSHYWPARNSNLPEWVKAAGFLKALGKRSVFIPDVDWDGKGLDGQEVDLAAATNLLKRARLYAESELNLFVNNGPAAMAWVMPQAKSIVFKMEAEAPCCNPAFFASHNIPVGSQLGRAGHRIVWADDTSDTIIEALREEYQGATLG
jgi:hypothetical protein